MSFIVNEIVNRKGMNDFLSLPMEIYKNDPNWICPQRSETLRVLDPVKNPYFKQALLKVYVCYYCNKPVSRAVMVVNHLYWQRWNKKSAFFGFFESLYDPGAVKCLFNKIIEESRAYGAEYLEGPFNPNHYSELGILMDNYNSAPIFFETHNLPYYSRLLEAAGFSITNTFHTRINKNIKATIDNNFRFGELDSLNKNITVRKFNIFRFRRDLELLREINNNAFESNIFFLPLSRKEYFFSAKFLFLITTPSLILFAEYKGKAVGAVQFVINFNSLIKSLKKIKPWHLPLLLLKRRAVKELIIFSAGVKKEFRNTRILTALFRSSIEIFRKYSMLSCTWISDEKLGTNLDQLLELKPSSHFAMFSVRL
jgi:hypothetical protein